MQQLRALLLQLQKNIVMRRNLIIRAFQIFEVMLVIAYAYAAYLVMTNYDVIALTLLEFGGLLGEVAIIFYVLTLLPGLITRLQWWPQLTQPISGMLMPFRRHLGISMFILVFLHMGFTTTLHFFAQPDFDPSKIELLLFQQIGVFAWWALFPLWLTSNDLSVKFMGKWWKRVHRLTYLALFLIFLHVTLIQTKWLFLIGAVGILELISWVKVWTKPKQPASSTGSTEPSSPAAVVPSQTSSEKTTSLGS